MTVDEVQALHHGECWSISAPPLSSSRPARASNGPALRPIGFPLTDGSPPGPQPTPPGGG